VITNLKPPRREERNEMDTYKTRRHQIRAFERAVKAGKQSLRSALRAALICGAAEERSRTLSILEKFNQPFIANEITSLSITEILDYEAP